MVVEAGRRPVEAFAQAAVEVASAVDLKAELAAAQLALVVRTLGASPGRGAIGRRGRMLELAGESLAAGGDGRRAAQHAVRVAVESAGARSGAAWRLDAGDAPELIASVGIPPDVVRVRELVAAAAVGPSPVAVVHTGSTIVATLPLGRPPFA